MIWPRIAASLLALIAVDGKRTHQEFSSETAICYARLILKQLFVYIAKINSGRALKCRGWSVARHVDVCFLRSLSFREGTTDYVYTLYKYFPFLVFVNWKYYMYMLYDR